MVAPCHRRPHAASSSGRLWCVRYVGEQPLFEQAGRRPVRLEVGGVDHEPVGFAAFGRQRGKDPVEHAQTAPPDETVVDRLVRTVLARRIALTQPVPDHEDDATDHPAVIDPRHPVGQGKVRLNPAHLRRRKPN